MAIFEKIPVLIVDDRPENLNSLEALLCDMGLDLVRATSGNEALRHTLYTDFALVLMDVQMPEMDGFEAADLMRKNPKTRQLPIIFLTAGMKEQRQLFKGYEAGAVDYLLKPIDPAILRSKVRVFCEMFCTRRELELQEQMLEKTVAERTAELSNTAELLRQSNARYRRLLESIVSYVFTVTIENGRPGKTVHSAACESVSGYSAEEYQAEKDLWLRITIPEDRQMLLDATERLLCEKVPVTIEHRILHRDGSLRWVTTTMVPVQGSDGSLLSYDGIVVDITERRRLEEQLTQSQKMESIGRLAGGVAHEFNNMLSVILGSAELLKMGMSESDPGYAHLEHIVKAGKRSSYITRQLLAFSRREIVSSKPVNMNALIQDSKKMLELFIGEDIRLTVRPDPLLWTVRIDPIQLDQLLMNLAANARDAMPGGGSLDIETANVRLNGMRSQYAIEAYTGEYVRLAVSDTGIGMDAKTREHIFEPFFTTKKVGRGTGLGLSTLFGIVAQNEGFVEVHSEPGAGTTFEIYLPRSQDEPVKEEKEQLRAPAGSGTILVVEDEEMLLQVTTTQLEEMGYAVIKAATPQEAIALYLDHAQQIQLVLTDVIMPEMSGTEMAERLRSTTPDLKVLFMSGYSTEFMTERGALSEGMHYIQKPLDMEELARKIGQILNKPTQTTGRKPEGDTYHG